VTELQAHQGAPALAEAHALTSPARGFVCSGALPLAEIADTAAEAEALGYSSLWITVLRGTTDPAAVLDAALGATERVEVGLGLVPLDAFPAAQLAPAVATAPGRAIVGLGVGLRHDQAATLWQAEAAEFRARAPRVRIAVGSYGPLVLRAGGSCADAVLLNWMTPERVRWAARQVDSGAHAAGRPHPPRPIYVYVPTAPGEDGADQIAGALQALARYEYHRRHQALIGPAATLGITVVLSSDASPPPVPSFGGEAVSVVSPTGQTTREQRQMLLRACAPSRS
jgi:alkanesulfonate monooxygenase SsuD/methylene tetrahydromethanopterin reductase-like flavin-dependent oxidoreductase (luciferase family)